MVEGAEGAGPAPGLQSGVIQTRPTHVTQRGLVQGRDHWTSGGLPPTITWALDSGRVPAVALLPAAPEVLLARLGAQEGLPHEAGGAVQ